MTTNFSEMGLKEQLVKSVEDKGFDHATPIQAKAIPLALTGKDIIGQAQTGTGKTAAFGLPMLQMLTKGDGLQGLVVCPTRELAVQVAQEIASLGRIMRIQTLAVYGGQSIDLQMKALRKQPEIAVGTPGRLLDHLKRGTIKLDKLKYAVLDEADEMLNMGFLEDITSILDKCPPEKQSMLFSATFAPPIHKLALRFMKDPVTINIKGPELTVPLTEQYYYEVNPRQKVETLCRILDVEQPPVAMMFCRTKKGVDELVSSLEVRGYAADALHGDLSQRERDVVTKRFRQGSVEILVATDVAARGLDINHVTHVINYDIPQDPDSYVHRVGRTGRAGREGIAFTLVEPREIKQLRAIEYQIKKRIQRRYLPSYKEAVQKRQEVMSEELIQTSKEPLAEFLELANHLLDDHESTHLLAAALQLLSTHGRQLETTELEATTGQMVSVKLQIGRSQGVNPKALVKHILDNTDLRPRQVGDIDIYASTTTVQVPKSHVDKVQQVAKSYRRQKNPSSGNKIPYGSGKPQNRSKQRKSRPSGE